MKKKKKIDLNKVSEGVKKASKITGIIFRIIWISFGLLALGAFIFVAVRIGQACSGVL